MSLTGLDASGGSGLDGGRGFFWQKNKYKSVDTQFSKAKCP